MIQPGTRVRLNTPDNPRLHGSIATVVSVAYFGAHVRTGAAATGQFRALFSEMVPERRVGDGYTGDCCSQCGSVRQRRNGSCLLCDDCGATSGCS